MKNVIVSKIRKAAEYKRHFGIINQMREGHTYTKLTSDQIKEVQSFYQTHFGKKISLKWHEYYVYVTKQFSPKYIPTYIYYTEMFPKLSKTSVMPVYSDKNMIRKLLGDRILLPKTYGQNINGIFYVDDCVVDKSIVCKNCMNLEDAVIKHSIDSSKGLSVLRFSSNQGTVSGKNCPQTIDQLIEMYGSSFIIQEAIKQNEKMAQLNPTSLNTVRIMTYWGKKEIVPVFAVVRMGRKGSVVDNASAGGLYCGINMKDGSLKENAYTLHPFSTNTESDNGIRFADFSIPKFNEMKLKAVELHQQLPYTKLIGWDLALNADNEIELVEINANFPGLFQAATGPAFGDYTEEILERCKS